MNWNDMGERNQRIFIARHEKAYAYEAMVLETGDTTLSDKVSQRVRPQLGYQWPWSDCSTKR